jgi:UDP-N-acetylmuramoyl-tripeptide--D-alanyl-D-alanine ligase
MPWNREAILAATGGKILSEGRNKLFGEIVTDSTKVTKGAVFVALKGERLDGHEYIAEAIRRGAGCVVVHRSLKPIGLNGATVIRVDDTLRALGDLAHDRRKKLSPKVLAITGSNGKTTTKEMVAAILERASASGRSLRGRVLKTQGNYNNLIGLPLTLLGLRESHKVAVVELGTNHPGEIQRLTEIADPDIGLITSVAPAHLEGLNSLAGVAREKGALFRGIRAGGKIIVNLEDPWVRRLGKKFKGKKVTFGQAGQVRAESVETLGSNGTSFVLRVATRRCRVRLNVCGNHNLINAVAAAAMAHGFGARLAAIRQGLAAIKPVPMRMETQSWKGIGIINDAYNANPASMKAALEALAGLPCRSQRVAVLGDMFELGQESRKRHFQVGEHAAQLGIERLYLLGKQAREVRKGALRSGMREDQVVVGTNHRQIAQRLRHDVRKGDWLLVKGSRGMKMEKVIEALKQFRG